MAIKLYSSWYIYLKYIHIYPDLTKMEDGCMADSLNLPLIKTSGWTWQINKMAAQYIYIISYFILITHLLYLYIYISYSLILTLYKCMLQVGILFTCQTINRGGGLWKGGVGHPILFLTTGYECFYLQRRRSWLD